jgi:hypothetical protein
MGSVIWDGEAFEVTVSRAELSLLLACLREAWEALDDEDFRIRTGFEATAARQLLSELRQQAQQARGDA